ncbi:hypothetical protein FA95DRAFT_1276526 [Auriscalpium vulgare]|uniref:Uncharacterized protein n=1 Tax=Auriscalpium vulgare TaxID=40419 RepID=A0ACB8RUQ8_9AGAM|nr:hypothetical protein FA95DRAFT_1276526 [Auriscalpium vulgare]
MESPRHVHNAFIMAGGVPVIGLADSSSDVECVMQQTDLVGCSTSEGARNIFTGHIHTYIGYRTEISWTPQARGGPRAVARRNSEFAHLHHSEFAHLQHIQQPPRIRIRILRGTSILKYPNRDRATGWACEARGVVGCRCGWPVYNTFGWHGTVVGRVLGRTASSLGEPVVRSRIRGRDGAQGRRAGGPGAYRTTQHLHGGARVRVLSTCCARYIHRVGPYSW